VGGLMKALVFGLVAAENAQNSAHV
jgi:hypothetical protein